MQLQDPQKKSKKLLNYGVRQDQRGEDVKPLLAQA
jgi:hypothetical protein